MSEFPKRHRPGGPFIKRQAPGDTVVPAVTAVTGEGKPSVTWGNRPGAKLRKARPGTTVLEPIFTAAGSSTCEWVGVALDSVDGDFTYDFVPQVVAVVIDGNEYIIRRESISIHEVEGSAPNTCTLRVEGAAPLVEQTFFLYVGDVLFFAGQVQAVEQAYEGQIDQLVWTITALDHTWALNRRRPFGTFTDVSASTVVATLMTRFAPTGFTATKIQAGLPNVTITLDGSLTFTEALSAVANLIGARYRLGYDQDLAFFLNDVSDPPLQLNNTTNTTLCHEDSGPPIRSTRDTSQLRNRVFVRGGGTTVAADVPVGATRVPVNEIELLPESGTVITGGQILSYGSTNVPKLRTRAVPPAPTLSECTELNLGAYSPQNVQVRTSWVYPDGYETAPGPPSATIPFDGTKKLCINLPTAPAGVSRKIWISAVDQPGEPTWTDQDTALIETVETEGTQDISLDWKGFSTQTGNFEIFHNPYFYSWSGPWKESGSPYSKFTPNFTDTPPFIDIADVTLTGLAGDIIAITVDGSGSGEYQNKTINTMPPGFTPVTASYRLRAFEASGGCLGIPASDMSVGGNAPATSFPEEGGCISHDHSADYDPPPGIVSLFAESYTFTFHVDGTSGKRGSVSSYTTVGPGSNGSDFRITGTYMCVVWTKTTLPGGEYKRGNTRVTVETEQPITEVFCPSGGTAIIDGQLITYTGIDGQDLIGIPEEGAGALGCDHVDENGDPADDECGPPVEENPDGDPPATVKPGINGNGCEPGNGTLILTSPTTEPIPNGAPIDIWVQRDDFESQAEFGVREYLVTDSSLMTIEDAAARGDAELDLFSQPIITVSYSTRDRRTAVGKIVDINMTDPPLVGSFAIQDVTITQIDEVPVPTEDVNLDPLYTVRASSVRFTLDDLLRRVALR